MGIISLVLPQKKNKKRVSLHIDGAFVCGLDAFTAEKYRLREGSEMDEARLSEIVFDSECESAFIKSMNLIHIRMRTRQEVYRYLTDKGYQEAVIEGTIDKLAGYGYLNDSAFAGAYIESYRGRWGLKKIEYMLRGMGIDPEILSQLFKETPDQTEEAFRLAQRYVRAKKEFDSKKLYAHLLQKGFEPEAIRSAIRKLTEECGEEASYV